MPKDLVKLIRDAGVIGAGGAGFPSHIKAGARAGLVIANGAECEPLAHADQELMAMRADEIVRGLLLVMKAAGAEKGVIALKEKYEQPRESLSKAVPRDGSIELFLLEDFYPAGDEFVLVHEITGKVIPEGNIPLSESVIVHNVGTLFHIAEAERGVPVTRRLVTVAGEVRSPVTVRVPIGTPFEDLVAMAGGAMVDDFAVIAGGPMMGRITSDLSSSAGKTTGMLLVLGKDHPLVTLRTRDFRANLRLIRSACTQCRYCTDLCPRYLLGHSLEPHKIMRALDYGLADPEAVTSAAFCSACGLCEAYSCVHALSPRQVNIELKAELSKRGYRPAPAGGSSRARREMDYRKVPSERLIHRLGLKEYHTGAPFREVNYPVRRVKVGIRQHIGSPSIPVVAVGDAVRLGELIADIPDGSMGARYHAPVSGAVRRVDSDAVLIEAA